MLVQVVMFPLKEFRNLAPYMEMYIVVVALVRTRVMQNESFCLIPYTDTYSLKKKCKLLGNSL